MLRWKHLPTSPAGTASAVSAGRAQLPRETKMSPDPRSTLVEALIRILVIEGSQSTDSYDFPPRGLGSFALRKTVCLNNAVYPGSWTCRYAGGNGIL